MRAAWLWLWLGGGLLAPAIGGEGARVPWNSSKESPASAWRRREESLAGAFQRRREKVAAAVRRVPPVTRCYVGSAIAAGAWNYLSNSNAFGQELRLDWGAVVLRGQWWRLLSCFLDLGPLWVPWALSGQFAFSYLSALEGLMAPRYDRLLTQLAAGICGAWLAPALLPRAAVHPTHTLAAYIVFLWSRLAQDQKVDLFGLADIPAHYLPLFFLAQTWVLERRVNWADIYGMTLAAAFQALLPAAHFAPPRLARLAAKRLFPNA